MRNDIKGIIVLNLHGASIMNIPAKAYPERHEAPACIVNQILEFC